MSSHLIRQISVGVTVVTVSLAAHVFAQGRGKTPPVGGAASASGAIAGTISGTFDSGGNFSGSGALTIDFSQDLPLVSGTGHGVPLSGIIGASASLTTLAGAGGSLLAMVSGDEMVKSVRLNWTNDSYQKGSTDPTNFSLHFRGDAVLDGVPEMSRLYVVCNADDVAGCRDWTLAPCLVAGDSPCSASDVSQLFDPTPPNGIGQLVGSFPKGVGNRDIARYVMNWSMTLTR